MTALRKFRALSGSERALLLRTMITVQLIKVGIGFVPFRVLRRVLTGVAWLLRSGAFSGALSTERVAWAVKASSKRTVGRTTCLVEALAAQVMLAAQHRQAQLHFGVKRDERGEVLAHAWVECGGRVVIGGSVRDAERYVPLAALDARSS